MDGEEELVRSPGSRRPWADDDRLRARLGMEAWRRIWAVEVAAHELRPRRVVEQDDGERARVGTPTDQ